MQSASDIFLGWTEGREGRRHFYMRQLRDAKMKPMIEAFSASDLAVYAQWCGYSLAHSHARSGDAAMISGYLGESDTFDMANSRVFRSLRRSNGAGPCSCQESRAKRQAKGCA